MTGLDETIRFQRKPRIMYRQIRKYVAAMTLTEAALSVNELVIGMIVSNILGAEALSIVSAALPVYGGCCAGIAFFGAGGSLLCGSALGRMKRNEAQRILSATMALALLTGICATVFGMNFRHEISLLLASGDPVQALVLEKYLFYLLLAAPVILLISIFSKFLTQAGAPGLASRLLILSNGMSVLFCYLLLAFGGFAAEGAALGVLLGYMTALAGTAYLIFAGRVPLKFVRFSLSDVRILWQGVPTGISAGSTFFWFFAQVYGMNWLAYQGAGAAGIAIHGVCLGFNSVLSVIGYGIMDTMLPMLAVMTGTKDVNAQRFILRRSYSGVILIATAISLLVIIFPELLLSVYGITDAKLCEMGRTAVRFYTIGVCSTVLVFFMQMHLAFLKHNVFVNFLSFFKSIAIVLPLGGLLVPHYGLTALWVAYMVSGIISLALCLLFNIRQAHQSKGSLHGVFLLPEQHQYDLLDFTINCQFSTEITSLAEYVTECTEKFGLQKKIRLYIGLAVEEMALLLQSQNEGKEHTLDVLIYRETHGVRIVFRDLGAPVNLMEQEDIDGLISNVRMLRQISTKAIYERMLMMNQHTFYLEN